MLTPMKICRELKLPWLMDSKRVSEVAFNLEDRAGKLWNPESSDEKKSNL